MGTKLYHVIFTGRLATGMDADSVKSNLILDVGLSEEKAELLLSKSRVLIKRLPTSVEAEVLAGTFQRAGAVCCVECRAAEGEGENSLVSFIKRLNPVFRRSSARSAARKG